MSLLYTLVEVGLITETIVMALILFGGLVVE
jgi:hypothetical protein